MAKRVFKKYTIVAGGTPQPLIGTTISAATGPGGTDPNGDLSVVNVAVTDSSMFQGGDWAIIGSVANGDEERVWVKKVPDGTHVTVQKMALAHVNGSYIRLSIFCEAIYVQTTAGNAAIFYLGTQGLVKATYANVIAELIPVAASAVQPIEYTDPYYIADSGDVGQYFVDGTTGDGWLPSLTVM
jgi:hypothetical protein